MNFDPTMSAYSLATALSVMAHMEDEMTKPEDIHQEAWDKAIEWAEAQAYMQATGAADAWLPVLIIARAITEAEKREREACAVVADKMVAQRDACYRDEVASVDADAEEIAILGGQKFIARCVATNIRGRG